MTGSDVIHVTGSDVTGSGVTGSDVSHMTGSDVTGCFFLTIVVEQNVPLHEKLEDTKGTIRSVNRMTNNIMTKRYQRNNQKP